MTVALDDNQYNRAPNRAPNSNSNNHGNKSHKDNTNSNHQQR